MFEAANGEKPGLRTRCLGVFFAAELQLRASDDGANTRPGTNTMTEPRDANCPSGPVLG